MILSTVLVEKVNEKARLWKMLRSHDVSGRTAESVVLTDKG
jgi:hypothetical protein